ncbi:hypothetical protein Droror1_Dr00014684 [Drosera rotundifolia]
MEPSRTLLLLHNFLEKYPLRTVKLCSDLSGRIIVSATQLSFLLYLRLRTRSRCQTTEKSEKHSSTKSNESVSREFEWKDLSEPRAVVWVCLISWCSLEALKVEGVLGVFCTRLVPVAASWEIRVED